MRTLLFVVLCVGFAAIAAAEAKSSGKGFGDIRKQGIYGAAFGGVIWYVLKKFGLIDSAGAALREFFFGV